MRFPISFNRSMRLVLAPMSLGQRRSYVDVDQHHVTVRMGWAFRATVPGDNVAGATESARTTISIGVHGWRGRWLVNGSGKRLVDIDIDPVCRGWVMGVPVRLRRITVSAVDPAGLVRAIGDRSTIPPK